MALGSHRFRRGLSGASTPVASFGSGYKEHIGLVNKRAVWILSVAFGLLTVPLDPLTAGPQQAQPASAQQGAFLQRYCVGCHAGPKAAAGLRLDDVDLERIPANPELWEKVVRKLHAGAMPPLGLPRPERSVMDAFTTSIEAAIDRDAKPDPGPSVLHRLNRAEYAAAVRDLLNLEVDVAPDAAG